ncbi:hypothetical protein CGCSCA5_v010275 [Colletotrichum siamense]|nr:hypothetical protein CGCSCA5_v010275 [Colletotrichum siamense]
MSDPSEYTIGWICALTTEYVAARSFLDEIHDYPESVPANDNNTYTLGRMGQHNIVMAFLPDGEYGLSSAAAVATDMVRTFMNVRIGLMVGIGGGAPSTSHDIRLGDVVVSSPSNGNSGVFQYDFGKSIQDQEFKTTGFLNQPPRAIRAAVVALRAEFEENGNDIAEAVTNILAKKPRLRRKYGRPPVETDKLFRSHVVLDSLVEEPGLEMLVSRPERTNDDDNPAVHYGLIASANQLMKDATIRDKLAASKGVLCFEMEAAGLMNHFPCLVIRGICDYSDSHKNKNWQGYAAMTAAAYAKALVCLIHGNRLENEKKLLEVISTALTQKTDNISSKGIKEQFEQLILDPLKNAQLTNARETEAAEIVKRARETNDREFENLSENMKYRKAISQADELSESELKLVTPPTLVLVIDALDECAVEEDIEVVIPLLSSLVKSKASGLKVFIASRPEVALRYEFHSIGDVHLEIRLHKVPNNVVSADIKTFFLGELTEIKHKWNTKHRNNPSRQLCTDWPGQKILKYLAEKAVPLFIHAATVCRFIRDPFTSPEVRLSQLLRTDVSELHDKMSIIYLPVLWQYKAEKPGPELDCVLERFRKVVGTVILLEQPLSVESISSFLNTDITDVDLILDPLRSVIDIPEKLGNPVKLFHLSFRDFLLSQSAEDFFINSEETHRLIALECLDILSNRQPLRYNICGLRPADSGNLDKKEVDTYLPPHAQYACLHLVSHMKQGKIGLGNISALDEFLRVHLLHLLEALVIFADEHKIRSIFLDLTSLMPRGLHQSSDEKDICDLFEEMNWFVAENVSTFLKYPLQLYWSALNFVGPGVGRIRRMFIDDVTRYGDSSWVISATSDAFWIHKSDTGVLDQTFPALHERTLHIDASRYSDRKVLASAHANFTVAVWATESQDKKPRLLSPHKNNELDRALSGFVRLSGDYQDYPDYSTRRVAGWFEGEDHIRIWDVVTGKFLFKIRRSANCLFGTGIRSNTIVTVVRPSRMSDVRQKDNAAQPSLLSVD